MNNIGRSGSSTISSSSVIISKPHRASHAVYTYPNITDVIDNYSNYNDSGSSYVNDSSNNTRSKLDEQLLQFYSSTNTNGGSSSSSSNSNTNATKDQPKLKPQVRYVFICGYSLRL